MRIIIMNVAVARLGQNAWSALLQKVSIPWLTTTARVLTLVLTAGLFWQGTAAAQPQPTNQAPAEMLRQIGIFHAEKAARTPAQQKMDSQLILGAKQARGQGLAGLPKFRVDLKVLPDGRVLVDIDAKVTEGLLAQIKAGGGEIVSSVPQLDAIRAKVTPLLAESLASRADVRYIRRADEAMTNVGAVQSEGDGAHLANLFRTMPRIDGIGLADGTGVKIGVLSTSVDYLTNSQASGDLGTVTVLPGQDGMPGSGEGTAMLEIVHDLAPGAELYFATGSGGTAIMAQNIRDLRSAGCDIIIDDISYNGESPFQDGTISLAVNDVSADGALFFSSARNSGNVNDSTAGCFEGDFVDGGAATVGRGGRINRFNGPATFNQVLPGGSNYRADLFWADPLGGATNDYDLYIIDAGGNVLRQSDSTQNGTQDPYEAVDTLNPNEYVVIVLYSGVSRFLHLDTWRGRLVIVTPGSTHGHNASGAVNAFSVAATSAATGLPFSGGGANPVETFSSDGPRRIFFHPDGSAITPGNFSSTGGTVLQKPDITAADNVTTTVPGFAPFPGTSAAAPHAGAIAALMMSFDPSLTPAQIRTALQNTALDIEAGGVDRDSGYGIVMPLNALDSIYRWVDFDLSANGSGTYFSPYNTMANGVAGVPTGGKLLLKAPRSTAEGIYITKKMRIQSVGGTAHFGN